MESAHYKLTESNNDNKKEALNTVEKNAKTNLKK